MLYIFILQSILHKALIPVTPGGPWCLEQSVVQQDLIVPPEHHPQRNRSLSERKLNQAGQRKDTQAGLGAEQSLLGHLGLTQCPSPPNFGRAPCFSLPACSHFFPQSVPGTPHHECLQKSSYWYLEGLGILFHPLKKGILPVFLHSRTSSNCAWVISLQVGGFSSCTDGLKTFCKFKPVILMSMFWTSSSVNVGFLFSELPDSVKMDFSK